MSARVGRRPRGIAVAAGVLYAALASLAPPLTAVAAVAVAIPAAFVLVRACARRFPADPRVSRPGIARTAVAWGAVIALAGGWELAAWLQQPAYDVASHDHPTISLLLDPVFEPWPLRFAAWCCWLYAGWRVVRR